MEAGILFLKTANLEQTVQFYQMNLGLPLVLRQAHCVIFQWAGTAFLGFCEADSPQAESERIVVTWVTDDVDGTYESWTRSGVKTDAPPRLNETYQIYHFYAQDHQGYTLEVQRFLDPHWSQPLNER